MLIAIVLCGTTSLATQYGGVQTAVKEEEEEVVTEVPVHVGKIQRATLHGYVVAYGTVELDPGSVGRPPASARVASPCAGILSEVCCVEGQRVAKGDVLFRLDSRLADVAVERARKAVEFAEQNLERQKKLQKIEGTSAKLYQEAELQLSAAQNDLLAAQTQRELLSIKAPLSGTIARVNARPGESVDLTTVMAELTDLDRLVVAANVPSRESPLIKIGQRVEFYGNHSATAASTATIAARAAAATAESTTHSASEQSNAAEPLPAGAVIFVAPYVDAKTDAVLTRISVPVHSGLRLGQFLKMRIIYEERRDRLVVPRESIVTDTDSGTLVAVVEGDKAAKRPVKVGLREGDLVEIEGGGLKEGMTVVTEGVYGLPNETRIKVIGKQHD
ncbi:efflux RND transporter periplasmic adaptor subunit [Candidatus Sumerlaeota bacterium]|nr:efflux RND transporter periplasmic adaptor subunit [Candidatus Sumerlaeota bacterium]